MKQDHQTILPRAVRWDAVDSEEKAPLRRPDNTIVWPTCVCCRLALPNCAKMVIAKNRCDGEIEDDVCLSLSDR